MIYSTIFAWLATVGLSGLTIILAICIVGMWSEKIEDFICDSLIFKILCGISFTTLMAVVIAGIITLIGVLING